MTGNESIKRHQALQPLSRDHHQGLLLSWKIRAGLKKGIDHQRIKAYADWYYKKYLIRHFDEEEKYLFPILGEQDELVKKAMAEHRRLARLFDWRKKTEHNLHAIEEELEAHIRFEERQLFNKIQDKANPKELKIIEKVLSEEEFCNSWEDKFWEKSN